jgi:hypothetical protein
MTDLMRLIFTFEKAMFALAFKIISTDPALEEVSKSEPVFPSLPALHCQAELALVWKIKAWESNRVWKNLEPEGTNSQIVRTGRAFSTC